MNIYGEYFFGNKISDYGLEHGYVDYGTLAKAFDAVLNNDIMSKTEIAGLGYWEQISGYVDNSEQIDELEDQLADALNERDEHDDDSPEYKEIDERVDDLQEQIDDLEREQDEIPEVFQWYIVSDAGADILKDCNEIVYYNEELDIYLWGVTHYGTAWSYVLTDIPCMTGTF